MERNLFDEFEEEPQEIKDEIVSDVVDPEPDFAQALIQDLRDEGLTATAELIESERKKTLEDLEVRKKFGL